MSPTFNIMNKVPKGSWIAVLFLFAILLTFQLSVSVQDLNRIGPVLLKEYARRECHPYDQGYIHQHQWVPLNTFNCSYPPLDLAQEIKTHAHLDQSKFAWLQNKTILLIGDSLDRKTVDWMCWFLSWNSTTGQFPAKDKTWLPCKDWYSCSHLCSSEKMNFTVLNAFLVGLNPDDSLRPRTWHHVPANQTMDPVRRLEEIYQPFISQVLKRDPDLVIFNSGLWDLMLWTRKFLTNNVDAAKVDVITPDRLEQYSQSLSRTLTAMNRIFPRSRIFWRNLPSTPVADAAWGLMDLQGYKANGRAQMFRNTYIDALNAVSARIIHEQHPNVHILDWHKITHGDLGWEDDVHPNGDGYKAVANMWLYELANPMENQPIRG